MSRTQTNPSEFIKAGIRWLETSLSRIPRFVRWSAAPVTIILTVSMVYMQEWESVEEFSRAIDRRAPLFQDFLGHYYPMARNISTATAPEPGYFYSAFFALLLWPLGLYPPETAVRVWGVIQCMLLIVLFAIPLANLIPRRPLVLTFYTVAFVTSFPLLHNMKWGQVSVLLTALIVAAFAAYKANHRPLAAVLVGLATSIKYYPVVFLLYFAARRDIRSCIIAATAIVVFYAAVPVVIMGPSRWLEFETLAWSLVPDGERLSGNPNSQHFAHVVARWLNSANFTPSPALTESLYRLSHIVFLFNAMMLWVINATIPRDRSALSLAMLFLSIPLVVKTSWPHYLCYLPFCQAVLFMSCIYYGPARRAGRMLLASLPLLSVACSSSLAFISLPSWRSYSLYGLPLLSNMLLLICLYMLMATRVLSPSPSRLKVG